MAWQVNESAAQATFPNQEPADPNTTNEVPANLAVKKSVLEAEALFTQEKFSEALKAYEKIYEKQSQDAWICCRLSILYEKSFQHSVSQNPTNNNTSELHANVVTFAAKAAEKDPKNHIYLLRMAQLYQNSYPHKSAQLYQQAIRLKPRNSSIYLMAAEHAAKQFQNQSYTTPTQKSAPLSPFTDTLLHIAQQYQQQFGLTNAYMEMMSYAYNRMPNKQSAKDSLMQQWLAIQFPGTSNTKTTPPNNATTETQQIPEPVATEEKPNLPSISRKIHESNLLFRCARLWHLSNQPNQQVKINEAFQYLEENFPYLDWSISKTFYEKNYPVASENYTLQWPAPVQLNNLNPAAALIIWQNIGYLSSHLSLAPQHYQAFVKSLEALEKHQSVSPTNFKQIATIIEYLLKAFNSNPESKILTPWLDQYKKLEDFN